MSVYQFGSGNLFGASTIGGVLVPRKFGALQDVSIDFSKSIKELFGQFQYPLDAAAGQIKIAGKAKFANINMLVLNDLFFGQTVAAGAKYFISQEAGTVTATLVTVANSATWYEDGGVTYFATGLSLTRVPSAPTVGQYSVAAGVYTFNATDNGNAVRIDYFYSPAATGSIITAPNTLVGTTPSFVASFPIIAPSGKQTYFRLNKCIASKLTFATKIDDWMIPEFDFIAVADVTNTIYSFSDTE